METEEFYDWLFWEYDIDDNYREKMSYKELLAFYEEYTNGTSGS